MVPKVKICGVTSVADAQLCVDLGVELIGLNFYPSSLRYIDLEQAKKISSCFKNRIALVGVFVNSPIDDVVRISSILPLDLLQFHGDESEEYLCNFDKHRVIKAIRVSESVNNLSVLEYASCAQYLLFDRATSSQFGGTGLEIESAQLRALAVFLATTNIGQSRCILAGGLTARNVREKLRIMPAAIVDVASGVESAPRVKDRAKLADFLGVTRGC